MTIDATEVNRVFLDSLFRDYGEVTTPGVLPPGTVLVEGVRVRIGFHPQRLESHREQVREWLALLPPQFHKDAGGGWSFLNACLTRDGEQWGEHWNVEQLLALGIGLNLARWLTPRDMWDALPGGMPYAVIDFSQSKTTGA